jgi:hypothetical protein
MHDSVTCSIESRVDVEELTSGALSSVMGTAASGDDIETIAMALARTRAINSTNCTATQS